MKPTDFEPLRTTTYQALTSIARTIVMQELTCKGEVVSRRAYWLLAELMREAADEVERDVGMRKEYAGD